jgi:hypothetical protein
MKRTLTCVLAITLTACLSTPTPEPASTPAGPIILEAETNPYAPGSQDAGLERAGIILISINLTERTDLDPTRVELDLYGSLPSVCNELRVETRPPNNEYQILVDVYSMINQNLDCDNVFQQFEASVLFGVYSPGRYTVWVNGGLIGDFVVN